MSDDQINLKVKQTSNNTTFDVAISKNASVLELKKACSELTKLTEKEQNLVYKGRILADDKNLNDYNVQNDHTIILVKKFVEKEEKAEPKTTTGTTTTTQTTGPSTTQTTSTTNQNLDPFSMFGNMGSMGGGLGGNLGGGLGGMGGMGGVDPSQLSGMLNNPQYMQMMNEMLSDPNTLNMILNNPQLKPLLDSNPQLRQMMQNPQMMQMMLNPQNIQNALNMMGGGVGGLGAPGNMGGMGGSNPFGGNMPGFNFGNLGTTTNQNVDPKVAYADQNQKLKDMGFINEDLNFEVLKQTGGNVDAAINKKHR